MNEAPESPHAAATPSVGSGEVQGAFGYVAQDQLFGTGARRAIQISRI